MWWLWRWRRAAPWLRPRDAGTGPVERVDFSELRPDMQVFVAHAGTLQHMIAGRLVRLVEDADSVATERDLAPAIAAAQEAQRDLSAVQARLGGEPQPTDSALDAALANLERYSHSAVWAEDLLATHLVAGILNDFLVRRAERLRDATGAEVRGALVAARRGVHATLESRLLRLVEEEPAIVDRLALWGRSLVGDATLVARSTFATPSLTPTDGTVEPAFTDLIAEHTRRMGTLGLTA